MLGNINFIILIKLLQCKGVRKYITVIYFNGVFSFCAPMHGMPASNGRDFRDCGTTQIHLFGTVNKRTRCI